MEVSGYKSLNNNCTNRHGLKFEEGKTYIATGDISFGTRSNSGFHMCKNLEDTLRYFPAMEEEIVVAKVKGFGNIVKYDDEYYGYYDMYAVEKITIEKFLNREEIINMYLNYKKMYDDRVRRFVSSYKLTKDEVELFKIMYSKNYNILNDIAYYQENQKDIYRKVKELER